MMNNYFEIIKSVQDRIIVCGKIQHHKVIKEYNVTNRNQYQESYILEFFGENNHVME